MFFYPKYISQEAIDALKSVGIEMVDSGGWNEFEIPDSLIREKNKNSISLTNGARLERHQLTFHGHQDPPKVWSSLEGDMVYSGRDLNQCRICGKWMSDKPSPSDEREHNRNCSPQYKWELASKVKV